MRTRAERAEVEAAHYRAMLSQGAVIPTSLNLHDIKLRAEFANSLVLKVLKSFLLPSQLLFSIFPLIFPFPLLPPLSFFSSSSSFFPLLLLLLLLLLLFFSNVPRLLGRGGWCERPEDALPSHSQRKTRT